MEEEILTPVDKQLEHAVVLKREDFVDDLSFNSVLTQIFGQINPQKRSAVTAVKMVVCGATAE